MLSVGIRLLCLWAMWRLFSPKPLATSREWNECRKRVVENALAMETSERLTQEASEKQGGKP